MIPLSDTKTSGIFPFVTIGLIIVNIIVFILELTSTDLDSFIARYALIPSLINFNDLGSLFSLVSAMFLHGDILHIGSNMLFLWVFGDNIEDRFRFFYLPFYLLGGIVASLTQYFLDPGSTIPVLGASGAVSAVLGAYLVFYPRHQIKTLVPFFGFVTFVTIPATIMLVYWFVLQLINGAISLGAVGTGGGVAWFAHIGGFATGFILALLLKSFGSKQINH